MAYVRKRGRQLLIVQGVRDSQTGKVDQRILFTIYSKAEALHILKQENGGNTPQFQSLLEGQYPDIKLDWIKILEGIRNNMNVLPDLYEYKDARLQSEFRKGLYSFARQLMLADPQHLFSAASLIQEHSVELEYLSELIHWRLRLCKQQRSEFNADNAFYWRFAMQGREVPPEIEEQVADFYERGEYERAAVLFRFLINCFGDYAEGYNYLGLISLNTGKLEEAIEYFRRTIEAGRRLFPGRIARSQYWSDLSTRPYMRGMMNLTLALNRAGHYREALEYCERLERECGDEISSAAHRASIYLNTDRWWEAADSSAKLQSIDASESLIAAFASFELGSMDDAITFFLHGTLNFPRAARILVGIQTSSPKNRNEADDHNAGVGMHRDISRYLSKRGRKAARFFERFVEHPRVRALVEEIEEAGRRREEESRTGKREAYDRMMQMRSLEFARCQTPELARLLQAEAGF